MERKFTEQELIRREKLTKLKAIGCDPYFAAVKNPIPFEELTKKYQDFSKEELHEHPTKSYTIAGRVMMIRDQGKTKFVALKNNGLEFQLYIRRDELSEKDWEVVGLLDLGDIIATSGIIMKTNTGNLTLRSKTFVILTKAVRPLPEKFHGLTDIEERYRRRYLDLIMNNDSREVFVKRSQIVSSIRKFLDSKGYLEMETPVLQATLGGAIAKPFVTHHNALDMEFKLRIATELHLKRLIIGGFSKVYEIGRLFRNEGISNKHNPEFTSIEIYEMYGDMLSMMNLTEAIIEYVCNDVNGTNKIIYGEKKISLKRPFKSIEMIDLIKDVTRVDFNKIKTFAEAKKVADEKGIELEKFHTSIGFIINEFFEQRCEETMEQPTFITGYPVETSPLAKKRKDQPHLTDRFELFIDGREYANGYSELNDADDQYERFAEQVEEANHGNEEASEMDIDFVEALEYGLPPTGGLGIGIDRLVMLLTDSSSIRDVLLFPHQRNKDENK